MTGTHKQGPHRIHPMMRLMANTVSRPCASHACTHTHRSTRLDHPKTIGEPKLGLTNTSALQAHTHRAAPLQPRFHRGSRHDSARREASTRLLGHPHHSLGPRPPPSAIRRHTLTATKTHTWARRHGHANVHPCFTALHSVSRRHRYCCLLAVLDRCARNDSLLARSITISSVGHQLAGPAQYGRYRAA